jgi:hypothetical protein
MMRRTLFVVLAFVVFLLGYSPSARADSLFIVLTVGGNSISCDNGTAGGVLTCLANGFVTSLGSNLIEYSSANFFGYEITRVAVSGNVPGNSFFGFVTDTKTSIANLSASDSLQVDFGAYDFTTPPGPNYLLSSSQTANWITSTAGDSAAFRGWARDDNANLPGGDGTGVAITPTIISPGGITSGLASNSPNVPITMTPTYSLTGRQVITEAIGSNGSFSGNVVVTQVQQVAEPASLFLLGTGLLGFGFFRSLSRRRNRMN